MSSPGPASPLVLSLRGVSKAFGAVQALREVSVDCRAGEIHALVGENGSGKSTLLGIASGFLAPDEGAVEIGGQSRSAGASPRPRAAGSASASPIRRTRTSCDLSVAENLYLAAPVRACDRRTDAWRSGRPTRLDEFDLDIPADRARGDALARGATAPRGRQGAARRAEGAAPRRADDGARAGGRRAAPRTGSRAEPRRRRRSSTSATGCRRCSASPTGSRVLRDGVCQGTFEAASMSEESLVALMIGRPLQLAFPERHEREAEREVLLAVSGLRGDRFGPIDLEVARGEILGIAGAEGNGQVQFLRALAGVGARHGQRRPATASELDSRSPLGPLRAGVVLLSGDRASRVALPRPERPSQHDDPGAAAARTLRVPQPPARAPHGRRSRAAPAASERRRSSSRCSRSPAGTSRRSR